jgi:hypothetical protein
MSIITTATELANLAGSKLGGFANTTSGKQTLTNLEGSDPITTWVNLFLPAARQKAIKDLARTGLPFRETFKLVDLGDDLKQDDVSISTLTGGGATVTVVTSDDHGFTTGDKLFLSDLEGTSGILALNNTTVTITVVDDTTFTFSSSATGTHTEDSGTVSRCPEIGSWTYAFNLPSDFLEVVGQYDETYIAERTNYLTQYPCHSLLNAAGTGYLFLTNYVSNMDGDSAYMGYVIDSTSYSMWSYQLVDLTATALAIMLCPVVARDIETQKRLEVYYRDFAIPEAQKYNTAMFSDKKVVTLDYTGGRNSGVQPRLRPQLGTFVDGNGNRRDVY